MISLTAPTIGTSAVRILEISAGSMSTWTTLAFGREGLQDAGHPVVEARAERDQQVGLLQGDHGGDRAVHAGHAEVLRVRVGEGAAGHQRGDHRGAGELGELEQLRRGVGLDDAAADVEHGLAGRRDEPGGLADLLAVAAEHRAVAGQVDLGRPGEGHLALLGVLGDVDEHGAGTAGGGDVERLGDDVRDVVGVA